MYNLHNCVMCIYSDKRFERTYSFKLRLYEFYGFSDLSISCYEKLPELKISLLKKLTILSRLRFKGYRCKFGIAIFAPRVTWYYAYSPFKSTFLFISGSIDLTEPTFVVKLLSRFEVSVSNFLLNGPGLGLLKLKYKTID